MRKKGEVRESKKEGEGWGKNLGKGHKREVHHHREGEGGVGERGLWAMLSSLKTD